MIVYGIDDFSGRTNRILFFLPTLIIVLHQSKILVQFITGAYSLTDLLILSTFASLYFFIHYYLFYIIYLGGHNLALKDGYIEFERANDFLGFKWNTIRLNPDQISFVNVQKKFQYGLIGEIHFKNGSSIKLTFNNSYKVVDRSHPFIDVPFLNKLHTPAGALESIFKSFDATPLMFYVIADHLGIKIEGEILMKMHADINSKRVLSPVS